MAAERLRSPRAPTAARISEAAYAPAQPRPGTRTSPLAVEPGHRGHRSGLCAQSSVLCAQRLATRSSRATRADMPNAYISGTGFFAPPRVVTNDDLRTVYGIDTSDEWI